MKIGVMNNPMGNLMKEIAWIGENRFDFIDLTLEPPNAYSLDIEIDKIDELLGKYGLDAVGHTAYYLPLASPFRAFCDLALKELENCFSVFNRLNITKVNLHPDENSASIFNRDEAIKRNINGIKRAEKIARDYGLVLMVENSGKIFNSVDELETLFGKIPDLQLHLDVGHSNLNVEKNRAEEIIERFHNKLAHIHFSDNKGGNADLHLPLGAGLISWEQIIRSIKKHNYDGTITLEVFSRDRRYLLASREKLLEMWN